MRARTRDAFRQRDLVLERGRHQHVALHFDELVVRDPLGALPADDGAGPLLVLAHLARVEPAAGVDAPLAVGERARCARRRRGGGARRAATALPKPWTATVAPRSGFLSVAQASRTQKSTPRARGVAAAGLPPSASGLPVTTAGARAARARGVGVHDPGHRLAVGRDVGPGTSRSGPSSGAISDA
jgi:hypothetical protein